MKLVITGNGILAAIGETSQLTATATFSDGAVQDVTSDTTWSSANATIISVSPKGLLTAVRYGTSQINASYRSYNAYLEARATPAGTVTISGRVHEPGQGHGIGLGLSNVQLTETQSGMATTTDAGGLFSFAGLTSARPHLRWEKSGYETNEADVMPNSSNVRLAMQAIVRVIAGQTVMPVPLEQQDADYTLGSGDRCFPCRLIRIDAPTRGMLHIDVTWTEARAVLALWVHEKRVERPDPARAEVVADLAVDSGELVVYVQLFPPPGQVPFTVATLLTPTRP